MVKADGYGHGAADVGSAALGAGATALCVATVPEGLALRQALGTSRVSWCSGRPRAARSPTARDAGLELVIADGRDSRGRARPPQARHRHGPVGDLRAGRARSRGRRADEPLRLCGFRHRVHRTAGRAVQRSHGALSAPDAPHREQRGRTRLSRSPLRRGALRDRALRHLSLRHRPGRGRARAGAPLGLRARPGQAPAAGRVDRLRPTLDRETSRRGSGSSRSGTRTASGAA